MGDAPSRWLSGGSVLPGGGSQRGRFRGGWFAEGLTPNEFHCHRVKRILHSVRTRYQECVLADTHSFGRCLVLDGETQSTQLDEFIYHEALVHPAMAVHPGPRRVLILGGGEGATAREVLRHRAVELVVMADIDPEVLRFAQRHLGSWHRGSFEHPKLRLLVEDARAIIEKGEGTFDVILSDLPSAIRGGPAYTLYTEEFYRKLRARLAPSGVFALQAGSGQILQLRFHAALNNTLRRAFPVVRPYYVYIPGFDVPWAFAVCALRGREDPLRFGAAEIDKRLRGRGARGLRFLDGDAFEGLFRVPRYLRRALARERRVIREGRPVYFFE